VVQVAIVAEAEKEALLRARFAQQQQLDQLTISQHQSRCASPTCAMHPSLW
jgi:hypothetical protein